MNKICRLLERELEHTSKAKHIYMYIADYYSQENAVEAILSHLRQATDLLIEVRNIIAQRSLI